ncbi:MAG: hypothetical protein MI923_11965 [Phycisphaerales bacterium]|nr:hypothetical protein [Phycisphaerales bacterium]
MSQVIGSTYRHFRFRFNTTLRAVATIGVIVVPASASEEISKADGQIRPDVAFQSALRDVSETENNEQRNERLNRIQDLSVGRHDHMIGQLLWYYATSDEKVKASSVVGRVLDHHDVPKQTSVFALIPHLDDRDASVREMTRSLLQGYEERSASRPPDFSAYRSFIEAKIRTGGEPSDSLVRHMYESDPGTALLAIMRGYQLRDPDEMKLILWAEHVVADLFWKRRHGFLGPKAVEPAVIRQLRLLAQHERWWVRMYVAEILRRHPELARPQVLESLQDDAHPLVRETILKATEKHSKRSRDP